MSRLEVRLARREGNGLRVLSRMLGYFGGNAYRMMQRQPGLRSPASRPWLYCVLAPFASSSSTTSCGFTVICTTLGDSRLNLESVLFR